MYKIALFASGSGTNVENIAKYFENNNQFEVSMVLCNKPDAYVLKRAENHGIPTMVFNRQDFYEGDKVLNKLLTLDVDVVVLAGFLWLIPETLIDAFPDRIINIHPALLPNYGGKGMYGSKVHEAVVANGEKESGISIHLVNKEYDKGQILFQATCLINPNDTADDVAQKVHALEYEHFPRIIEKFLLAESIDQD